MIHRVKGFGLINKAQIDVFLEFSCFFDLRAYPVLKLTEWFSLVAQSCPTLCNPMTVATQASLSITKSGSMLKLMSIESVMPCNHLPSNHLIFCCPLLLLPSIFPSIRVFSNESALRIRWPKYWSFSFTSFLPVNT